MSAPGEFEPYLVYERIGRAIEAATGLRQMPERDDLVGGRVHPPQLLHRRFRIEPRGFKFPTMKARPGDVVIMTETVAILMNHDLIENGARGSYAQASHDFVDVLKAVLTRTEISGIAHPLGTGGVSRRSDRTIEHELVLSVTYHVTLPAASGPE